VRHAILVAALFCAAANLHAVAQGAAFIDLQEIHKVQLAQLLEHPNSFLNTRVQFRCTWVQEGDIYDPIHTQFSSNRYVNQVVWDDEANIWDPTVRAQPLFSVYVDKVHSHEICEDTLRKYDIIEVTGEVCSTFGNKPWINCRQIEVVKGSGRFSDNAIYHIEQAVALSDEGTRDIADQHYADALGDDIPDSSKYRIGELAAKNQMAAGNYGKCITYLKDAVDDAEDANADAKTTANLRYLTAKALTETAERASSDEDRKNKFSDAADMARSSLADDPTLADAYAVLGISLAGLGDYEEARRQCAQAVRLQPNVAEVRWYLGRIYLRQGLYDESIEALKKGIDLTPKDARLHHAIAAAYLARGQKAGPNGAGDIATALKEYDIAIRLNPNHAGLFMESGALIEAAIPQKIELQLGAAKKPANHAAAAERYESALKIDPKNIEAHLAAARCYQADGKIEDANKHQTAVLDLDPKNVQRYIEVANSLATAGHKEQACEIYERCLKVDDDNINALFSLGNIEKSLGKSAQATRHLELAVRENSKHVGANLDLADLAIEAGNLKSARSYATRALDYAKTDEDKARANALIEACKPKPVEKAKKVEPPKKPAEKPKAPAK
jgi:tetratricopeptide (TPR) repeat protein